MTFPLSKLKATVHFDKLNYFISLFGQAGKTNFPREK